MDPEAVIDEARGDVDRSLLTGTGGGFLSRAVLAEEPLVSYLREEETLQYLLAGPAAPTRVEDRTAEEMDVSGSYRTLLAVTDARVLVVAGSEDGDRALSFPYGELLDVRHEGGLLTDTVVLEDAPDRTWEVTVGSGYEPTAAVDYARDRLETVDVESAAHGELVATVFEDVVDGTAGLDVEQYRDRGLDELVDDLAAHHDRLLDHLDHGEVDAARGAAATVDAIAAEGERLADERDRPQIRRRVTATRRQARRAVVAEVLGVDDQAALDDALAPALVELLQAVDPYEFEAFVADLWSELGYQTTVTQSSKDKGVDVVARQATPVEETVVIQAKRYGPDTRVGREEVQQYASLHRQEPHADLVVVVTTGSFTGPAEDAAGDLGVKLVDGDRLADIVVERELYGLLAECVAE